MSFPRYERYKDSGIEWLGEVPEHWASPEKLGIISSLKGRLGWQGLKAEEYLEEGPYVVSSAHFSEFRIRWEECPRVSQKRYETDSNIQLKCGDILLMKDGAAIGKLAFVDTLPGEACLNSHLLLFRPIIVDGAPTYSPKFAFYFMQTAMFQEYIKINGTGATFLGISQEAIATYKVVWPSFLEQCSITAFLDRETAKIDALIDEQKRLIELLKEKRQAVISHAVTKGLNPDAPMKDSVIEWLGEVPEHWNICHLKRMTKNITDGSHVSPETENGIYEFISTKDVSDDGIDFDNCLRTSEESYKYLVRTGCKPFPGDVLFSKDGTIGRTVVVTEDRDFVVASSLIIIRPDNEAVTPDFLNFLCQSGIVIGQVESFVKGAGLPRLSIQNLLKIIGVFPPISEQQLIVNHLNLVLGQMTSLLSSALDAITLLQERRTALISAAVTGKIDVRGLVETQPEREAAA